MGEHIALAQPLHHLRIGRRRIVDMNHHRHAGLFGHLQGIFKGNHAMDAGGPAPEPDLDADNQVPVGRGHLDRRFRVHQTQLFAFAHHDAVGKAENPRMRNMEIGQYPDL